MADGTEIVKLKTIVNLKSRQAGFRAKKRCGRGESREAEDRGRWKLRQGREGRREKRGGGGDAEGGKTACAGGRTATRVEMGRGRGCIGYEDAGGRMQGKRRRGKAGEGRWVRGSRRKGKPSLENLPARGRGEPGTRMRRTACGDASGERPLKRKSAARMEWQRRGDAERRRAVECTKL